MHLLQLVSCLALVVGASTTTHMESSESGRLSCANSSTIEETVRKYEIEQGYDIESVVLNCCVEETDGSLRNATVSAFFAQDGSNSTGIRFEFSYVSGTVFVRELRHVAPLNFSGEGMHCFECNASAPMEDELCNGECVTRVCSDMLTHDARAHTQQHAHTHTQQHTHTHTHTHSNTRTHTRTHTQQHTHSNARTQHHTNTHTG